MLSPLLCNPNRSYSELNPIQPGGVYSRVNGIGHAAWSAFSHLASFHLYNRYWKMLVGGEQGGKWSVGFCSQYSLIFHPPDLTLWLAHPTAVSIGEYSRMGGWALVAAVEGL